MPNIWHLAHQTPKTNPHQVLRISNILPHRYSTVSNMRRYGHQCQKKKFAYFIYFSLSSQHIYLSLRLQPLSSLVSISPVAPYFFLTLIFFFLSLTLFLSRPHSTPPTSSHCRAADLAWSSHSLISSSLYSATPRRSLSLSLLMFGCFDCWWLADFG